MNTDDISLVFKALDDQNRGYIDKSCLLETFAKYSSATDVDDRNEEISRIEQLMEPYEKIRFTEFKKIYLQFQRPESNYEAPEDDRISSTESSDIDKDEEQVFKNKKSFLASPDSARKRGLELINQSKANHQRFMKEPITTEISSNSYHLEVMNLQELDGIARDNERMIREIKELEKKLNEEEVRFQKEKYTSKQLSEKVYGLESEMHDIEMKYRKEIKEINERHRIKMDHMEEDHRILESKWSHQLAEMKRQQNKAREDNQQVQNISETLSAKYDSLLKDYSLLQTLLSKSENIMVEYKRVASHQVTELQSERDELELVNKELYLELQATKHFPKKVVNSLIANEANKTVTRNRLRIHSAIVTPFNDTNPSSNTSGIVEEALVKSSRSTIETDMNRVVHLLSMENRDLVERIAHLETVGFYQKQKLEAANCVSLADEMDRLSLEEMRKALTVERETVKTLRDYMESMTIKLLTLGYIDVFQQR